MLKDLQSFDKELEPGTLDKSQNHPWNLESIHGIYSCQLDVNMSYADTLF